MGKIVVVVRNRHTVLRRKTFPIRGRLRFWLFAAFKTLHFITSAVEESNGHAEKAVIELHGIARDEAFHLYKSWVEKNSPITVEVYLVEKVKL